MPDFLRPRPIDYSSPEERKAAIKEKFEKLNAPPTPEQQYWKDLSRKGAEARREKGSMTGFANNPVANANASRASAIARKGMPAPISGNTITMQNSYKSFAKMIRGLTNDGWELVEAVHTMFQEAYAERNFDRTLNAATWLADRGFGKPVQVTALTDAEGNPVAFQLWQPMTHDAADDSQPPVIIDHLARPEFDTSAPPTKVEKQPDIYALGPARIWGQDQDKEQIDE